MYSRACAFSRGVCASSRQGLTTVEIQQSLQLTLQQMSNRSQYGLLQSPIVCTAPLANRNRRHAFLALLSQRAAMRICSDAPRVPAVRDTYLLLTHGYAYTCLLNPCGCVQMSVSGVDKR
jgi:hypothetical protein